MKIQPIQIGIIGYRGFGAFCTEAFHRTGRGRVISYAGRDTEAMAYTAKQYDVPKTTTDWQVLVSDPDIELVHIVTPPHLHAEMAIAALEAGKHVLIEKPMATSEEESEAILAAAWMHPNQVISINYVMRYSSLYEKLTQIRRDDLLGPLTHVSFQNYASDEGLADNHWFWNKQQSGGIFVEHGVHFFDIIGSIIGAPAVTALGQTWTRQDRTRKEDRVSTNITYSNGIEASYYHAFNRPGALEKQLAHFAFERGHVTLEGWIPTAIHVEGILDDRKLERLHQMLPTEAFPLDDHAMRGNGKDYYVTQRAKGYLSLGDPTPVYSAAVGAVMVDLADAIRFPATHQACVTAVDGAESLRVALASARSAETGRLEEVMM